MTALGVLSVHPDAQVVGIDESADMLAYARQALPAGADLRVARIEDPLLEGPFDLVVSALAVHHLDGEGKADLFARVARVLAPGGQFVLGDVVVPDDPGDVVTPIDGEYDTPSRAADQVGWTGARQSITDVSAAEERQAGQPRAPPPQPTGGRRSSPSARARSSPATGCQSRCARPRRLPSEGLARAGTALPARDRRAAKHLPAAARARRCP